MDKHLLLKSLHGISDLPYREIKGACFSNEVIQEITAGPAFPPNSIIKILDCVFKKCKVTPGTIDIMGGVELKNVTFEIDDPTEVISISSYALFDNVKIKGKIKDLLIRPEINIFNDKEEQLLNEWIQVSSKGIDFMLDISEIDIIDDIEIYGIASDKMKWNKDKCVLIKREWLSEFDIDKAEIPKSSYWRFVFRRLKINNFEEGLFSLPSEQEKNYQTTVEERQLLSKYMPI